MVNKFISVITIMIYELVITSGKEIHERVVNFFIDIHNFIVLQPVRLCPCWTHMKTPSILDWINGV